MTDLRTAVEAGVDEMVDIRRDLHRYPELSFKEHRTTVLIHERLRSLGFTPLDCPTETGAVYALDGGRPGRTVLIRADVDALPIHEANDHPWASATDGVMHACGHDAHTAIALGVAQGLTQRAEDLPGRYVFLFQPGEEEVEGAKRVLDGDLLDRVRPDGMLGCHVGSVLPTGTVAVRAGVALAGLAGFSLRAVGSGGHAALDGDHGSPVLAMARVAVELRRLLVDLEHEGVACVATSGLLRGGTAFNVVPVRAELVGSLRTFSPEQEEVALRRLRDLVTRVATEEGVAIDLHLTASTPPVVNDPAAAALVRRAAQRAVGPDAVVTVPPVTASDDCAELLAHVPGCYFLVGAAPEDGAPHLHHSPSFDIDERCLRYGAAVMAEAAVAMAAGTGGRQP